MPNHTIINAININQTCFTELYNQVFAPAKILANLNKVTIGLAYTNITQTNLNREHTDPSTGSIIIEAPALT
jgi:hypothetical protein